VLTTTELPDGTDVENVRFRALAGSRRSASTCNRAVAVAQDKHATARGRRKVDTAQAAQPD
jgi:hypothetical protein